ncbi:DNA helicase UvrD [Aeromonas caviae]|uniref:DNA helicase UvrD n=1 Tax=Aeromonas caviae TaxID=648 RepID=UPI002B49184E|nr:DNA helicase UvrD [Aeromonas caviae]
MDKRIVLAVAGSGKTKYIIDKLSDDCRALIITYTVNNYENIKKRVLEKFGFIPKGVRIYTYFSFIMSFCIRPIFLGSAKIKGVTYNEPPRFEKRRTHGHYFDRNKRVYHSRASKLLLDFNLVALVSERIERYFDLFCIDEIQDFSANDFNFVIKLFSTNINILMVGDYFQHTFDTSRDGNIQKNLHDSLYGYIEKFRTAGFAIDTETLSHSYRCSPTVCEFIVDNLGIEIRSHREDVVGLKLLLDDVEIQLVMGDDSIVKLFYRESNKYVGRVDNWGNTKGLDDFNDVCIVLNKTTFSAFQKGKLAGLAPSTLNKLYVACTRSKGNLYFLPEEKLESYKR